MNLQPIETATAITDSYISYLTTSFNLKNSYLAGRLKEELQEDNRFAKGPFLEAIPPFKKGNSLEELIEKGVLSQEFYKLESAEFTTKMELYLHQEEAINKIIAGRNLVVATGTGSGKTETFMIPILNHLFREKEYGNLSAGVRALLLYPMNALANDQLKRLRGILTNYPEITFGRYTSETKQTENEARDLYLKMNRGHEPLPNELISRQRMWETPPHILLTNYAMLEYLLLRPQDNVFFDGKDSNNWHFLVLDEVHTYAGAKGIETGILLRRLKERIGVEGGALTCIGTSATLGSGEEDYPEVCSFARNLFGEEFQWDQTDSHKQDVVGPSVQERIQTESWGSPEPQLYSSLLEAIDSKASIVELSLLAEKNGVPSTILQKAATSKEVSSFIYNVLVGDSRIQRLIKKLQTPQLFFQVEEELFKGKKYLSDLLTLATLGRSKGGQSLISARYHHFIRALEGAFIRLAPTLELFLEPQEKDYLADEAYQVFELASCRQCGSLYLVGETIQEEGEKYLKQSGKRYHEEAHVEFYLLNEQELEEVEPDEDDEVEFGSPSPGSQRFRLCAKCGAIAPENFVGEFCSCGEEYLRTVLQVKEKKGKVNYCPACGKLGRNLVERFLRGRDTSAAVLATSLFQKIPAKEESEASDVVDEWGGRETATSRVGEGRQLLIFSDNRQHAAFFAPYLASTHELIFRRRLIYKTLLDNQLTLRENRWRVDDLITPLINTIEDLGLESFRSMSLQKKRDEVTRWLLYELVRMDDKNSLEALGCLGFSLVKPHDWVAPGILRAEWGLSDPEAWMLYQILLDGFRTKKALVFPDNVRSDDEFFAPRNHPYFFRGASSVPEKGIYSWSSGRGKNARLDYLLRLVRNMGKNISRADVNIFLAQLWERGIIDNTLWQDYFVDRQGAVKGEGAIWQLKWNLWELVFQEDGWYVCDRCKNLTRLNLRSVCPRFGCEGKLVAIKPATELKGNHYYKLFTEIQPVEMIVEEHTAQLSPKMAAELQNQFIAGQVNVLSCSTTFELGVDIGKLEAVFLRNVPPSAANYTQRAGRAGRRSDSVAFALTYAQRRSHDLTHYKEPLQMITGKIQPPHFIIRNPKIILRHMYATALAHFWRENPETFKNVDAFFFQGGYEDFKKYLAAKPLQVRKSLGEIVPHDLQKELWVDSWKWVDLLLGEEKGVLLKANQQITSDVESLEELRKSRFAENRGVDYIQRLITTLRRRSIIDYLSSNNVLPKYGFPVDVVELSLLNQQNEAENLKLERDLKIAISEYAPDSEVIARGKVWVSRYIKKVPNREWIRKKYAVCEHCGSYQSQLAALEGKMEYCEVCHGQLKTKNQGQFIVPEFGFFVDRKEPARAREQQPRRSFSRVYYSAEGIFQEDPVALELDNLTISAFPEQQGKLVAINDGGRAGFRICNSCGYATLDKKPGSHDTPWGSKCKSEHFQRRISLGHEFQTDVLHLQINGYQNKNQGFWYSLLYAILEGASAALEIERRDIEGCLYAYSGDPSSPRIVLFDDVPGGAGHVKRISESRENLLKVLTSAYSKMTNCTCGGAIGDSSCYSCLRNYSNQFCHDELKRGQIVEFFEKYVLPYLTSEVAVS